MENLDIKNLKDKRVFLCLLIQAHKAGTNAEKLEWQIKYWKMMYPPKAGFRVTDFNQNMQEYIKHLEAELKEEKEFLDNVVRKYCTDQNPDGEAERVFKYTCERNGNTDQVSP